MLISKAYAQAAVEVGDAAGTLPEAPGAMEAFMSQMGLVLVVAILFYLLLIRPQQKRFKEHTAMLDSLKKGDKVVTGGGLVGTIDKISAGNPEVIVDLGSMRVTAMRSSLQAYQAQPAVEQDNKKADEAEDAKKSAAKTAKAKTPKKTAKKATKKK